MHVEWKIKDLEIELLITPQVHTSKAFVCQMDPLDQTSDPSRGQYGVLKLQSSPTGADSAGGSVDLTNSTSIYYYTVIVPWS